MINFDDRLYRFYFTTSVIQRVSRRIFESRIKKAFNRDLINYIKSYKPDLFVCFKTSLLSADVFEFLPSHCKTVMVYPDLDPRIHGKDYVDTLGYFDIFFHTKENLKEQYKSINKNSICINTFYSEKDLIFPVYHESKSYLNPVLVAHYSKNKYNVLRELSFNINFDIDVYGSSWPNYKLNHILFNDSLFGPPVYDLYKNSLFCLGLLQDKLTTNGTGDVITSRSYLVPLNGGLLVHHDNEYARRLYGDDFILFFDDTDSLNCAFERLQDNKFRHFQLESQFYSLLENTISVERLIARYIL